MSEEIKLYRRTDSEIIQKLLADGLASSGGITRACLTSMAVQAERFLEELTTAKAERDAYREVAIDADVFWELVNSGEIPKEKIGEMVDAEAQQLLSQREAK